MLACRSHAAQLAHTPLASVIFRHREREREPITHTCIGQISHGEAHMKHTTHDWPNANAAVIPRRGNRCERQTLLRIFRQTNGFATSQQPPPRIINTLTACVHCIRCIRAGALTPLLGNQTVYVDILFKTIHRTVIAYVQQQQKTYTCIHTDTNRHARIAGRNLKPNNNPCRF